MERAVILVGTETGTAEDVADDLLEAITGAGMEAEILDMEEARSDAFDGSRAVVICTATTGDGELPENSIDLFEVLEDEKPDLSGVVFGVCALGDDHYEDFCQAGKDWSALLQELGAKEIIDRFEIDGFPEDEDIDGAKEWVGQAAGKFTGLVREG
ncbi:flavodoxin domain-containing protein [Rubrobacter indicoceani]|uniref:flavodoxin domain-containing protein n=1 Tax=Rubrobacter indicoceani TaxID=2051957 RepID=UPI000E5A5C4E|nr:flavodoxin domain-containing protein [Rubrobacter indicoceani]